MGKKLHITTCCGLYIARMRCFQPGSGTTATEKLLKISAPASFCLLQNCSMIHCSLQAGFVQLAYESNYGSAANSMPSNMKNELLVILEVDFGQFCATPSRERRYKVRSAIFRFSDRF